MSRLVLPVLLFLIFVAFSTATVVPPSKDVPATSRKSFAKAHSARKGAQKATSLARAHNGNEENHQDTGGFGSFSPRVGKYDKVPIRVTTPVVKKASAVARDKDSDTDDSDSDSDSDDDSDDDDGDDSR